MDKSKIRNIAIIAHVDHGKTTLVDGLLKQSKTFRDNQAEMSQSLIMDSGDQEHERGITITAKTTSVFYGDYKINIIDTPGHADFSGEVERTLNMADGVILVVDAQEGPMPQTKFVLNKALQLKLKPVVIINKIDKPAQRIAEVEDEVANLFLELATDESQLFYPVYYAIAREGKAWVANPTDVAGEADLTPIFEAIVREIPEPKVIDEPEKGLQMLATSLDYDNFLGKYVVGKILRGKAKKGEEVVVIKADDTVKKSRIDKIFTFKGLGREETGEALAGDIVAITGLAESSIGDTVASVAFPDKLPSIEVEAPTLSIYIGPNTSPLKGREGDFTTSRQIGDRLKKELETNIAMRLEEQGLGYKVSGRGELHLSVLIETMRREGFEMEVGRPEVVYKEIDGVENEPIEDLTVEVDGEFVGAVSQELGLRRAEMLSQEITSTGATRLVYKITTAALIGLRNNLLTATKGTVLMSSIPAGYKPTSGAHYKQERNGVLIAFEAGQTTAYALNMAEARGVLYVGAGAEVYAGMIVGLNNKKEDLDINVCKGKQLTNMRSKASDGTVQLTPFTQLSLEQCLDFIGDDELLEVTPKNLRLRKRYLDPNERKRAAKNA
ncbi:MAG: translational GTPase TypA [Candidatus Nomurabacteria bacterium]|jgi:GTP-binding protein|nr:translational GTPase TypA [Candidatus Nomurabacteria bacterium]